MAEFLTHVLIGYSICTVFSWYVDWMEKKWIAIGMVGSILPDINRPLTMIISDNIVTYLIGTEFLWLGTHTVGGIILLSGIGALLFRESPQQSKAFMSLLLGAISHIVIDLPQKYADGRMILSEYMFPIPAPRPPTPGLYVTPNRWVVFVAFIGFLFVFGIDRYWKSAN